MGREKGYKSHLQKFPDGFAATIRLLFNNGWTYKQLLEEFERFNPKYHDLWKIVNNKTYRKQNIN